MTDTSPAAIRAWCAKKVDALDAAACDDPAAADTPATAHDEEMFRAVAALADLEAEAAAEIARLRARPTWAQGVEAAAAEVVRLRMEFCNDRYATQPEGSRGERVACNWIEAAIRAMKEPEQ